MKDKQAKVLLNETEAIKHFEENTALLLDQVCGLIFNLTSLYAITIIYMKK